MGRISKIDYYLNIAKEVASRGTCLRRNFGSIIVKNDVIISTGYTGAPRGRKNCCDIGFCVRNEQNIPRGERYELCLPANVGIRMGDGSIKRIGTLCDAQAHFLKNNPDQIFSMKVWGVFEGNIQAVMATGPYFAGRRVIVRVAFADGTHLDCTPNHSILLVNDIYKEARELKQFDIVMGYSVDPTTGMMRPISKRVIDVKKCDKNVMVYDITVPSLENFAVAQTPETGVFVHNCRSVHSEVNAIINASREMMIGATLYLVGLEKDGSFVENASCCAMCKRTVINAGIKNVIIRQRDGSWKDIQVQDWVNDDETLSLQRGY